LIFDASCQQVGNDRFQAVANLNPELMLVHRDKQEQSILFFFLPDAPAGEQLVRKVVDLSALQ